MMNNHQNLHNIHGWSVIKEYLERQPQRLKAVYLTPQGEKKYARSLAPLSCPVILKSSSSSFKGSERESSIWAQVSVPIYTEKDLQKKLIQKPEPLILALDHITDPHNFGSLCRSAAFFGLSTILIPKDRQAPIQDRVVAAARGAFLYTEVYAVSNLPRALVQLKKYEYWIIGAQKNDSLPMNSWGSPYPLQVLVLGNEEKGLSHLVAQKCDRFVGIPSGSAMDSLNVAVAGALLMNALKSPLK